MSCLEWCGNHSLWSQSAGKRKSLSSRLVYRLPKARALMPMRRDDCDIDIVAKENSEENEYVWSHVGTRDG